MAARKTAAKPKIAVFVSFSGEGGVERMMLNLCRGFLREGCQVDLIPIRKRSLFLASLPEGVNCIDLGSRHTRSSLPGLIRYLRKEQPNALLSAKDRANQIAILAGKLSGTSTPVGVRLGTTVTAFLESHKPHLFKLRTIPMRRLYPQANSVIAVSHGVAEDFSRVTGISKKAIRVIENPVITPDLDRLAREHIHHPWLEIPGSPVIMGMGRLTEQKDFLTLIRAFSILRHKQPGKLIILGAGRKHDALKRLIESLGLGQDVDLPGFVPNPYPYLAKADVFVLSSIWEGSPNALTEAMALGRPVVSTNCPSGPSEILTGKLDEMLVPMADPERMAAAILLNLRRPPDPEILSGSVIRYRMETSARRYLDVLLGGGN